LEKLGLKRDDKSIEDLKIESTMFVICASWQDLLKINLGTMQTIIDLRKRRRNKRVGSKRNLNLK
jgi:hypothetical protein